MNIPYFALGLPASRENSIGLLARNMLPKLLGRQCAAWIEEHCADTTLLMRSRNYLPLKTAFYCDWLKFTRQEDAQCFMQAWPKFDPAIRLSTIREQHTAFAIKLQRALSAGGYDLGQLPGNQRWSTAKRYLERHERLRKLEWDCKNLELAAELGRTWSAKVDLGDIFG